MNEEQQFQSYLDDSLSELERQEFEARLLADEDLSRRFEAYSAPSVVPDGSAELPPPDLRGPVRDKIRRRSGGRFFGGAFGALNALTIGLVVLVIGLVALVVAGPSGPFGASDLPDPPAAPQTQGETPSDERTAPPEIEEVRRGGGRRIVETTAPSAPQPTVTFVWKYSVRFDAPSGALREDIDGLLSGLNEAEAQGEDGIVLLQGSRQDVQAIVGELSRLGGVVERSVLEVTPELITEGFLSVDLGG